MKTTKTGVVYSKTTQASSYLDYKQHFEKSLHRKLSNKEKEFLRWLVSREQGSD